MTNWVPTLGDRSGPRYLAMADQWAHGLENGRLKPGDRLPTHRELAWKLGITVGTVTRAYGEAERRGLIAGEVGRGTFIRDRGVDVPLPAMPLADDEFIDLARNFPTPDRPSPAFIRTIADVAASPELGHLLSYATNLGLPTHPTAAVPWLARSRITAPPGEIVITNGAQHGMILAMAAVAHPGDVVLTEQLTFYGMKSVAALLSLRLHGVAIG